MKQVAGLLCVTSIDCSRSSSTMLTLRPLSVIADCQICVKSSGTRERHTVSTSLPLFADPTFSTINTIKVNPAFSNISSAFHPKLQNINLTAEYRMRMKNQLLSSQESMHSWLRPLLQGSIQICQLCPHFEGKCHFHFLIH